MGFMPPEGWARHANNLCRYLLPGHLRKQRQATAGVQARVWEEYESALNIDPVRQRADQATVSSA